MKKRNNNRKYLKIFIIGVVIIIIIFYTLNNNSYLNNLKFLSGSIININFSHNKNKSVNDEKINSLKKEIEELKKINKIDNLRTDYKEINARVTKRSTFYWHNFITISKGKAQGISEGNAVMNNDGLIGIVESVNKNSSEIRLITNINKSYLSCKFNYNNEDYYGIIKRYNVIKNELVMENVVGDFDEKKVINTNIVSSGLSSNIPSGLLIGKIKSIKKDKYNLSSKIKIEMSANLNDLNIVTVIQK